jgi:hypothetical protein
MADDQIVCQDLLHNPSSLYQATSPLVHLATGHLCAPLSLLEQASFSILLLLASLSHVL